MNNSMTLELEKLRKEQANRLTAQIETELAKKDKELDSQAVQDKVSELQTKLDQKQKSEAETKSQLSQMEAMFKRKLESTQFALKNQKEEHKRATEERDLVQKALSKTN